MDISSTRHLGHRRIVCESGEDDLRNFFASSFPRKEKNRYVTSDDKVKLPNYLVHLPSQNDVIMEIGVEEGLNEGRNGGYLDDDGDNVRDFKDTIREVEFGRSCVLLGSNGIEQDDEGGMNSVLLHVEDTM